MQKRKQRLAILLTVILLLLAVTSAVFLAVQCMHHCTNNCCPVCLKIRLHNAALHLIGTGILLLTAHAMHRRVLRSHRIDRTWYVSQTPVRLKIKLTI